MNTAADEIDHILERKTIADWAERVCWAVIVVAVLYLAAHVAAWAELGFRIIR